jgi:cystathionine beta-lyase
MLGRGYVAEHLSEISVVPPEGTYLIWLDCRRLGLDQEGLKRLMEHKAGSTWTTAVSLAPRARASSA